MNRPLLNLLAVLICLGIAGCPSKPLKPPVPGNDMEGFEAFATPRAFDGPGTIYRIDKDTKRLLVETLSVKASGGAEFIPKFSTTHSLSADQLLKSIGAKAELLPASVKGNLSSKRESTIESTAASRAMLSDKDISKALEEWASTAKPIPGSVYYFIRETISTKALNYKVSRNWLAGLGLDAEMLNVAGYKGEVKGAGADELELKANFSESMNVWYKAEQVVFTPALGAGPGQFIVQRTPVGGVQGL